MNSLKSNTSLKESILAIRDSSNNNKRLHHSSNNKEEAVFNMDDVLTWPPRSYTCSFCRREFRSAQALGGHMNVHRKDRARLKGSSPPRDISHGQYMMTTPSTTPLLNLNLNLNKVPNPNPNLLSTSPSSPSSPFGTTLPPLISPPPPPPPRSICSLSASENMKWVMGGNLFDSPLNIKALDFSTKMKNARVGNCLFDGLIGEDDQDEDQRCIKSSNLKKSADEIVRLDLEIGVLGDSNYKEDLDLELRLGYS